jgi:hypothetical protein
MYLDKTAKERYEAMREYRENFLTRGRECSELTLPAVLPDDSVTYSSDLYTPYQSVGARGVNNLASKLLLLLLPPNQPFFRLVTGGETKEQIEQTPEMKTEIERGLAKIEREVMSEIEMLAIRVPVFEALKHLIISGNVLVHMPKKGPMRVFPLNQYVCRRDPEGAILELVVKESVSPLAFEEETRNLIMHNEQDIVSTKAVDVYTKVCLVDKDKYYVCQEANNIKIPKSEGTYKKDDVPWNVLRMVRMDNVEEYL